MSSSKVIAVIALVLAAGATGWFFSGRGHSERSERTGNAAAPVSSDVGSVDSAQPNAAESVQDQTSGAMTSAAAKRAADAQMRQQRLSESLLPGDLQRGGATTLGEAIAGLTTLEEGEDRSRYFQDLLRIGLQSDPAATLDVVLGLEDETLREHGMAFALHQWSLGDAPAALRWAAEHPRARNDASRFYAAYEGYAATQPEEALRMLARAELADDREGLARVAIFHVVEQGKLGDARGWIEGLPDGELRDLLVQQTVRVWGRQAPAEAAAWLATTASEGAFREGMGALVHALADTDPGFAAGLTQQFAEPWIREGLLADAVYLWAKRDLGGAAAWLRGRPQSPQLDAAIVRLAEAIAPNDPGEARHWANMVYDPRKRAELLRTLAPE